MSHTDQSLGDQAYIDLQEDWKERFRRNLKRVFTVNSALFCVGVVAVVCVGFAVVSDALMLKREAAVLVTECTAFLIIASALALSVSISRGAAGSYLRELGVFLALSLPIAFMYLGIARGAEGAAFWVSLFLWICVTIAAVHAEESGWELCMLIAGTVGTVSTVLITAGMGRPFSYASTPLETVTAIHTYLDLRKVAWIVFLVFALSTALLRVFVRERIVIPPIRLPTVPHPDEGLPSAIRSFLLPFIRFLNLIVWLTEKTIDSLWKTAAHTIIFFTRVGEELGRIVWGLLQKRRAVAAVAQTLGAFFVIVISAIAAISLAPGEVEYLRHSGLAEGLPHLGMITVWILMSVLCVVVLSLLWELRHEELEKADPWESISTHLLIVLIAGGLLYGGAAFAPFQITGFSSLGPYSASLIALVVIGMLIFSTPLARSVTVPLVEKAKRRIGASDDKGE